MGGRGNYVAAFVVWFRGLLLALCVRLSRSPGLDLFGFKETAFYHVLGFISIISLSVTHRFLPVRTPTHCSLLIDHLMEDFMLRLVPRLCDNYGLQLPVQGAGHTAGPTQQTPLGGGRLTSLRLTCGPSVQALQINQLCIYQDKHYFVCRPIW